MNRTAGLLTLTVLAGLAGWRMGPLPKPVSAAEDAAPAPAAEGAAAEESVPADEGWISLFDGQRLTDWEPSELPFNWSVEDGAIVGRGSRSHLFYKGAEFENCEFKAEVQLNAGGNSGMYFRTEFGPGWPKGYEAQVNNSHRDPVRTGSLYNLVKIFDQKVPDDTWWTQHIIVQGNHIVIKVNDEVVVDFIDEANTHTKGYLALQQHDPGSVVRYRNLMVKPLPATAESAEEAPKTP